MCVQLTARKGNGVAAAEGEEVKSRSRVGNQMRAADWWGGSRRCGSRRGEEGRGRVGALVIWAAVPLPGALSPLVWLRLTGGRRGEADSRGPRADRMGVWISQLGPLCGCREFCNFSRVRCRATRWFGDICRTRTAKKMGNAWCHCQTSCQLRFPVTLDNLYRTFGYDLSSVSILGT